MRSTCFYFQLWTPEASKAAIPLAFWFITASWFITAPVAVVQSRGCHSASLTSQNSPKPASSVTALLGCHLTSSPLRRIQRHSHEQTQNCRTGNKTALWRQPGCSSLIPTCLCARCFLDKRREVTGCHTLSESASASRFQNPSKGDFTKTELLWKGGKWIIMFRQGLTTFVTAG